MNDVADSPKHTILAVDDTPENLDVVKGILVPEFTVKAAVNGQMALKIAKAQHPDLILLDIMMPEMDGYEVCQALKADEDTRDIPVIFLTAKDQAMDEAKGLEIGSVDYITKPISPSILQARVRTHLMLADTRKRLAAQNDELMTAAQLREDMDNIMRHDLKSPLTAIIGVPQFLLMKHEFEESERELIKGIEAAGSRMLQMINMSLDLFKMESGTYTFRPEATDLLGIIKNTLAELSPSAERKSITCRATLNGETPADDSEIPVMAESLLCYSLFSNLIKNAIEAAPDGDTITVNFDTGAQTVISVENGGEVPEAIRPTFFEKYVTAGKQDGTGLGTYSAKLSAETQNGKIELDSSTPGRTSIRVTLATA